MTESEWNKCECAIELAPDSDIPLLLEALEGCPLYYLVELKAQQGMAKVRVKAFFENIPRFC